MTINCIIFDHLYYTEWAKRTLNRKATGHLDIDVCFVSENSCTQSSLFPIYKTEDIFSIVFITMGIYLLAWMSV